MLLSQTLEPRTAYQLEVICIKSGKLIVIFLNDLSNYLSISFPSAKIRISQCLNETIYNLLGSIGITIGGQEIFPVFNNLAYLAPQKCEVDTCNQV